MTNGEREVLNRQIGVLEGLGLACGACTEDKFRCLAAALYDVVEALTKLMDGGAEDEIH